MVWESSSFLMSLFISPIPIANTLGGWRFCSWGPGPTEVGSGTSCRKLGTPTTWWQAGKDQSLVASWEGPEPRRLSLTERGYTDAVWQEAVGSGIVKGWSWCGME
jgi:hypothetical protein